MKAPYGQVGKHRVIYTLPELAAATGYSLGYLQQMAAKGRIKGATRDPLSKHWTVGPPAQILTLEGELLPFQRRTSNKHAAAPDSPSPPRQKPYA